MNPQTHFEQQVAPGVRVIFDAERLCYRVKSAAHEKLVIDHDHFGRMMMVDGAVRWSTADAFVHHEMMSHVPLFAHGQVERVLIVGGGDFGIAAEVLEHPGVSRLVQVEGDPQLVKLAQAYFPQITGSVFGDAPVGCTRIRNTAAELVAGRRPCSSA
jgi:spermidine synthase